MLVISSKQLQLPKNCITSALRQFCKSLALAALIYPKLNLKVTIHETLYSQEIKMFY